MSAIMSAYSSFSSALQHPARYRTLRVEEDRTRDMFWLRMHADLPSTKARPCFRTELVEDIVDLQTRLKDRLQRENRLHDSAYLPHVVLASDADVFNLGGDLRLFCAAIRAGDRETLMEYAHQCVRGVYAFHNGLGVGAHTIALVQGDALGGGFEAALSCHTIVAERGVGMGLPEVLFDLFPGMGAYSFLCKRISPKKAEKIMLDGMVYSSEELHEMGLVDVLVEKGQGVAAVEDIVRANRRIPHARAAMHKVRELAQPVDLGELMRITEIWVETAMQLGERSLRTMERLVRAQERRGAPEQEEQASDEGR